MRALVIASTLLTVALLSGCSGTTDDTVQVTTSPDAPGVSAMPDPTATASETGDNTAEPDGSEGENDGADAFCAPAVAGTEAQRALLDATDLKSAETGKTDNTGDVAAMNAAGDAMLAAIDDLVAQWSQAQGALSDQEWDDSAAPVSTKEADDAFSRYFVMVDAYTRPEATIAATAGSITVYDQATMQLMSDPTVTAAVADGGEAWGQLLVYIQERCGDLTAFA
jgi:hypothetical protein